MLKRKKTSFRPRSYYFRVMIVISLVVIVFVFFQNKDGFVDRLPITKVPQEAKDGQYDKNLEKLWLDNGQYFALASEHCLYYRQANEEFPIKSLQSKLRKVQIFKLKDPVNKDWLFVSDLTGVFLGWIKKDQVSFKDDFEVVKFWTAGNFEINNNNKTLDFKVKHKGYIELKWQDRSGGIYTEGKQKGQLLENGYLIWAKIWNPYTANYFFYMDRENQFFEEEEL